MMYINKFSNERVEVLSEFTDIWGRTCVKYRRINPVLVENRVLDKFSKPLRIFKQTYEADSDN